MLGTHKDKYFGQFMLVLGSSSYISIIIPFPLRNVQETCDKVIKITLLWLFKLYQMCIIFTKLLKGLG